jgi:hypothetical protein
MAADTAAIYPTAITEETTGEHPRLMKTYVLAADEDPSTIPTADFEREGYTYTLLDLTRQDQTETDSKLHTEPITVESKSKDMDKILPLLPTSREVTTEDGYTGLLTLDTASVQVEVAGYGSSSRTVTATRSYPNLSDADTAFVPKTIQDSGRTLTLADVQWQEAGGFFHATATYTGTATSKYATGYVVTANYTGEVSKTTSDAVTYTAVFSGTPCTTTILPLEQTDSASKSSGWKWLLVLPVGAGAAGVAALAVFAGKKLKSKKEWKEFNQCDGK